MSALVTSPSDEAIATEGKKGGMKSVSRRSGCCHLRKMYSEVSVS